MFESNNKKPFELSKLGDPLLNLIYSLSLSNSYNRPMGKKVSNLILAEALEDSGLRSLVGARKSRGDLGDFVEGLLFKLWNNGEYSIDEAVEILSAHITPSKNDIELRKSSIKAFSSLLKHLDEKCSLGSLEK